MKLCCFYVHALSGSKEQILHVFPHMWKLVLKSKFIHIYIYITLFMQKCGGKNSYCDGNSSSAQ
jgi:hypothetical protein